MVKSAIFSPKDIPQNAVIIRDFSLNEHDLELTSTPLYLSNPSTTSSHSSLSEDLLLHAPHSIQHALLECLLGPLDIPEQQQNSDSSSPHSTEMEYDQEDSASPPQT